VSLVQRLFAFLPSEAIEDAEKKPTRPIGKKWERKGRILEEANERRREREREREREGGEMCKVSYESHRSRPTNQATHAIYLFRRLDPSGVGGSEPS